jgi:hypothetical protein
VLCRLTQGVPTVTLFSIYRWWCSPLYLPRSRGPLHSPTTHLPALSRISPVPSTMFTSHKSNASLRSGLSEDITTPCSLSDTSILEPWIAQNFDEPIHGSILLSEQRHKSHSSKRSSVFNLRSRSNTANSTSSIPLPLNPSMSHGVTSRPETPLSFQQHGHQGQPEQSGSKKSLFRGRMGKRLSESVSSGTAMTDDQEKDTGDKRMSVLQRAKRWNSQPENHRKCCIAGMADSATY